MDENDKTIAENSDKARWVSSAIFKNAARRSVIKKVLMQAYPSGRNIDEELVNLL